eukprot:jgi/Tetstr1/432197/TSEL_021653.t1
MQDATPDQLSFMAGELPRFLKTGALERGHSRRWVSRVFLMPKPGTNKWRLIIDLRHLNRYCKKRKLSYETLKHLKNLTRKGGWLVSFDLTDGYYTLGIIEADRDFFTVDYRGTLYRLAGLPKGWRCSNYYFCKLTEVFVSHPRAPEPTAPSDPAGFSPARPTLPKRQTPRSLRNTRWKWARLLPYMADFLFFAE